jgi:superfamily I DNA/RNA helicase
MAWDEARSQYYRTPEGAARHAEQVRRTNRARARAVKQLIAEKPERYDELLRQCGAAEDPPVNPLGRRVNRTEAEKIQARIDRAKQQLKLMGVDPDG